MKQKKKPALNKPVSRKELFKANDVLLNVIVQMIYASLGDSMTSYISKNPPENKNFMEQFRKSMDYEIYFYLEQIENCYKVATNDAKIAKDFSKTIKKDVITPYVNKAYKILEKVYADKLKG